MKNMIGAAILFDNGDKILLRDLYASMFGPLCSYSSKHVKSEQIAGDIAQDVFIKVWKKRKDFTSIYALRSFMYLAARNASLNYLRDNGKTISLDNDKFVEQLTDDYLIIEEEVHLMIRKEVDKLPRACKKVFNLTLLDMSISEISECLEISKHTVRNQRAKARKILRSQLKGKYFLFFI